MRAAFSKAEIESEIALRFGSAFQLRQKSPAEILSTGVTEIDALCGGLPRGGITEFVGPASSGRTSLLLSTLAYATTHDEICAMVDISDVFVPGLAAAAGVILEKLLWIRCASTVEPAFKAVDLISQAGGFGLIILDMGDVAGKDARRIISSWWYRFRRTLENTLTAMVVIAEESCVRSCASLSLELKGYPVWSADTVRSSEVQTSDTEKNMLYEISHPAINNSWSRLRINPKPLTHANLLKANSIVVERRRPVHPGLKEVRFKAIAQA
ncbi:MAG TPA: hypothetical protein DHU55_19885 [Blastocatellia bacterium]|nr:hypothetical protein [Blastocatellia bacterium]